MVQQRKEEEEHNLPEAEEDTHQMGTTVTKVDMDMVADLSEPETEHHSLLEDLEAAEMVASEAEAVLLVIILMEQLVAEAEAVTTAAEQVDLTTQALVAVVVHHTRQDSSFLEQLPDKEQAMER